MNILHVSAVKSWGGGENHIENLCRELIPLDPKIDNTIVCAKGGLFHEKLKNSGLRYIPVKLGFKMDPRFSMKLVEICKSNKIDLLHIHDSTALTLCIMGDHLYNLPPFIFSKKTSFPIRPRKQTLYKYNYEKIKRILCVSDTTKELAASMVLKPQKLKCIYHGTNVNSTINKTPLQLRTHLKLKDEIKIIGNIANHNWPKDLETFIMTANEIVNVRKLKDIHFVQIGAYTNRTAAYLKKVQELHLEEYISFINKIPNAKTLIPQFNISLMTSISEGIPQFIYESFLYRTPVVSTNVGGISEIIEDGKNGFLAPAGDFKMLANRILQLIDNKTLIDEFTAISYDKVNNNYNTEMMAAKTYHEYKMVLNGK